MIPVTGRAPTGQELRALACDGKGACGPDGLTAGLVVKSLGCLLSFLMCLLSLLKDGWLVAWCLIRCAKVAWCVCLNRVSCAMGTLFLSRIRAPSRFFLPGGGFGAVLGPVVLSVVG